jgi:hypothetical protein
MSEKPAASSAPADYKYWAFISDSHQDNLATRGDGILISPVFWH